MAAVLAEYHSALTSMSSNSSINGLWIPSPSPATDHLSNPYINSINGGHLSPPSYHHQVMQTFFLSFSIMIM